MTATPGLVTSSRPAHCCGSGRGYSPPHQNVCVVDCHTHHRAANPGQYKEKPPLVTARPQTQAATAQSAALRLPSDASLLSTTCPRAVITQLAFSNANSGTCTRTSSYVHLLSTVIAGAAPPVPIATNFLMESIVGISTGCGARLELRTSRSFCCTATTLGIPNDSRASSKRP